MTLHRASEGSALQCFSGKFLSVCLSVRLSVTTLAKASLGSTLRRSYVQHWYRLSRFLTRGFSKKPSVQKLWRKKGNMLRGICLRCSDISPEFSKTGPSLILSKSNGRLHASKAARY